MSKDFLLRTGSYLVLNDRQPIFTVSSYKNICRQCDQWIAAITQLNQLVQRLERA